MTQQMADTFGDIMFFFIKKNLERGLLFDSCHFCLAFSKAKGWEANFLSLVPLRHYLHGSCKARHIKMHTARLQCTVAAW